MTRTLVAAAIQKGTTIIPPGFEPTTANQVLILDVQNGNPVFGKILWIGSRGEEIRVSATEKVEVVAWPEG